MIKGRTNIISNEYRYYLRIVLIHAQKMNGLNNNNGSNTV